MAVEHLNIGESLAGLLVDEDDATPYIGATLRLEEPVGVRVEVPYVPHPSIKQFEDVTRWFRDQSPPENLLLFTADGPITLYRNRWMGHSEPSGVRLSLGTIAPAETVLAERDGALADPLEIKTVQSRLDGLNRWIAASAVSDDADRDDAGHPLRYRLEVESQTVAEWQQGAATMSIRSGWQITCPEDAYSRTQIIHDNFVIQSEFESSPRSFYDHFVEHRKLASLLVFMFAKPISFREHKVRDERFAARLMSGEIYNHPFVELISELSVRERSKPVLSRDDLGRPIASLSQVTPDGLATWASNYDTWKRFILPVAGVLGRPRAFIEDVIMSTSVGLEAAGQLIGEREGEVETYGRGNRPSVATYIFRCLDLLGVQWGDYIQSDVGLARPSASNYNDVKHFDRGDFPAHEETLAVADVNRLVARLLALHLTGQGDALLEPYRRGENLWSIQQLFEALKVRVDHAGKWRHSYHNDIAQH